MLNGNFLGMHVYYRCLAIRALSDISFRLLVVERLCDTKNSSVCCSGRNLSMSLWSSCGFVVVPIIKKRLHGLELATTGRALVSFFGSERLCGLDVIVGKSLSLCMPSFLLEVQFWKETRLVKSGVRSDWESLAQFPTMKVEQFLSSVTSPN